MNLYNVLYRIKGNVNGETFETVVMADNCKIAKQRARHDLENQYTIVRINKLK